MKKPFLLLTFLLAMSVVGNCYAQAIDSTFIHQADSIRKVGVAFLNKADYTNALIECNKSFGLSEKINYKKGVANALNSIGVIYNKQSDYANALNHYQKSLKIREEIGDKIGIAQSFSNIGLIYKDQGDFAKALEYHNNSLKVQEEIGDKKQIANLLTNIGNIYSYRSDNDEALEYYAQSLKIREDIGDKNGIASSLLNIGVMYKNQGNLSKALEYYTQSLKISEEIGNKSVIGASLNNIGLINFTQGDYAKALEYYTQSLKIKEGIGDKSGIALSLNNIGNVYWYQGNFAKALEYLTQSLKINEETGVKFRIAASLSNISIIYKDQYNYTKALECSNNSLKIQEEIGDKEGIAASLHNIGLVYFLKGNYVKAIEYYTQSLKIQEEIGADKKPGIKWLAKAYTLSDTLPKAKHYAKELVNELNKDIKTNYFTLSDNEKTMYFATMENDFGLYHNFTVNYNNKYVTLSDTAYNIALQNKGLSLKSSTAMRTAILNSKDTSLLKQYDEWIFLKKKIAKLYESGVLAGSVTAADSLENIANEMERQLVKKSTAFSSFDKVRNLDWKQVQKSLKKDEAAIEFVHFINVLEKDTVKRNAVIYAAYIVTKNNTHPQAVQLCTEIDLIKILGNTQGNNLNFVNNVYGTQSQQQTALYEKIWQPLEYHLKGIKNIYYSPDGLLHKISFSAISNGKNSFYAISITSIVKVAQENCTAR
ncbi:MAG: tetratricopeptide repeat protein [Bacteroidetes bacterium]|nr:tetratricopeptide repeat protein [Bacteroidota bacterium]